MIDISLRLDVKEFETLDNTYQMLYDFIMLYHPIEFVTSCEEGKLTGKKHFHAYVRCDQKYETVKKQWQRKFSKWNGRRQERSIATCRDRDSLIKYICKDGYKDTNIPDIKKYVGKWKDSTDYGRTLLGKLKKYADDKNENLQCLDDCLKIVFMYTKEYGNSMNKYRMLDQAHLLYANVEPEECLDDFMSWARNK